MAEKLFLISDSLITDYGPSRPVVLLSHEFSKIFNVSVVSSAISTHIKEKLQSLKVAVIDLRVKPYLKDASLTVFDFYLREAIRGSISEQMNLPGDATILNFSNTIVYPSLVWYAQGPVSIALKNIRKEMPLKYKFPLYVFDYALARLDKRVIKRMRKATNAVIANSQYCKTCYKQIGIEVNDVIYEPLDCDLFKPSTSNPSADYALTYFGKETEYSVIKKIADVGVKIKAFGGKLTSVPRSLVKHPNVETLGRVDQDTLTRLYSNALYTLFPFTDEEFGYVPAESMACGTPVLTYGTQGPAEVVVDGVTGWLVKNEEEMTETAVRLWKDREVSDEMRFNCRKVALKFEVPTIAQQWLSYIDGGTS
jgi:glycosyltransferase involved in cell wall biosynthesis